MATHDGAWEENAPKFDTTTPISYVLALEPEGDADFEPEPAHPGEDHPPEDLPAVDADRVVVEQEEKRAADDVVAVESGRTPAGWRIDKFGRGDGRFRTVSAPPWSHRAPWVEPEQWIAVGDAERERLRARWRAEDPTSFYEQEEISRNGTR